MFTAFITVPEGYRMKEWKLQDITCEGAKARSGFTVGNTYIAMFRTQDLQSVTTGKSAELTVKGVFNPAGKKALVQATDAVKIIN